MSEPLRYLLDEDLSPVLAQQLRNREVDAVSVHEVGRASRGIPDGEQIAYAQEIRRVFVTSDYDFIPIAHAHRVHWGVMIVPQEMSIGGMVRFLELSAGATAWHEVRNAVTFGWT